MNNRFSSYVSNTAFSLNLSKSQIAAIICIYENNLTGAKTLGQFGPSLTWLREKGLIHFEDQEKYNLHLIGNPQAPSVRPFSELYTLTKAGELVVQLLQEAGYHQIEQKDVA